VRDQGGLSFVMLFPTHRFASLICPSTPRCFSGARVALSPFPAGLHYRVLDPAGWQQILAAMREFGNLPNLVIIKNKAGQ
jgi:hypothetical protein